MRARGKTGRPFKLGLLDRLLDDFPEEQDPGDPDVAAEERRRPSWEAHRESLRRDLEMLLTTRAPARAAPSAQGGRGAAHPRVAESVARYGVAFPPSGFSGQGGAPAQEAILRAVAVFEPRFRDPRPFPGNAGDEPGLICALAGWVDWGGRKDLVAKIFAEGDGWKVELYE